MRLQDIRRLNGKWVENCLFEVSIVGTPYDSDHGLCQTFEVSDGVGYENTLHYYYTDPYFEATSKAGKQWFKVRYKNDCYQCVPQDPPADFVAEGETDWDAIARGKCRYGFIVKCLERTPAFELFADKKELKAIADLAVFAQKGDYE